MMMTATPGYIIGFSKHWSMRLQLSARYVFQSLSFCQPHQHIRLASGLTFKCSSTEAHSPARIDCSRPFHSTCCLRAGHSKWHNIKHIKAAADREKGAKSNLLSRKLQLLFDKNPITDPKLNTDLAQLIKWARTNNLTNEVINKTVDRQIKRQDPKNLAHFGGRGPLNTGIMIECFALKPVHTKSVLQGVVKKYGFNLNAPVEDLFEHKGVIEVELSAEEAAAARANPDNFSLDKYIEIAINAGAEDVTLENDGENLYLQFVCAPLDVNKVTRGLSEVGLNIVSSERTYIPKIVVPVTQEFIENIEKLTDKLDLNADVIKYYFNVEPESEPES